MTRSEFELFRQSAQDFMRQIDWFHKQSGDDKYQQEMLEDLTEAVKLGVTLIDEATEGQS